MPKRSRIEVDEDAEFSGRESTPDLGFAAESTIVISSILRMILTRSGRHQKIRKEHFTPILHKHHIKGNIKHYIVEVNKELESVFGLKIVQNATDMVLVSSLQKDTKKLLLVILDDDAGSETSTGNPYDLFYFMNQNKRKAIPVSTQETLFGGIVMLVLGLVIISENRIRESDLLDALRQFGFSENLNIVIPTLNKTTQEFLSDATKREYLEKEVAPTRNGEPAIVNYMLGKRALREFDLLTMLEFLEDIVQLDELKLKCRETINRCFPDGIEESTEMNEAEVS